MFNPDDFVDPTKNQISFVTVIHNFRNVTGSGPALLLKFDVVCNALGVAPCEKDPIFQAVRNPLRSGSGTAVRSFAISMIRSRVVGQIA